MASRNSLAPAYCWLQAPGMGIAPICATVQSANLYPWVVAGTGIRCSTGGECQQVLLRGWPTEVAPASDSRKPSLTLWNANDPSINPSRDYS